MASKALDALIDQGKDESTTLKTVASFKVTLARDSKGNPGLKIAPVLSDGSDGRFGDLWIRLAEGPETLRALRSSLPAIAQAIDKFDAYMVKSGDWKEAPKAKVAATAAPAAPAPAPKKSAVDAAFDDLPF